MRHHQLGHHRRAATASPTNPNPTTNPPPPADETVRDAESLAKLEAHVVKSGGYATNLTLAVGVGHRIATLPPPDGETAPQFASVTEAEFEHLHLHASDVSPFAAPLRGLYAADEIDEGATLYKVPWSLVIRGEQRPLQGFDNSCTTIKRVRDLLMMREQAAAHKPHLDTLPSLEELEALPNAWSASERALLGDWFWSEFPSSLVADFEAACQNGMRVDATTKRAVLLFASRKSAHPNTGYMLIPLLDALNHAKEDDANVYAEITADFLVIKAAYDIAKHEELRINYHEPFDTGFVGGGPTAELFSNYGIVDGLPQNWTLPLPSSREDGGPADPFKVHFLLNEDGVVTWPEWQRELEGWSWPGFRAAAEQRLVELKEEAAAMADHPSESHAPAAKTFRDNYASALTASLVYSDACRPRSKKYVGWGGG